MISAGRACCSPKTTRSTRWRPCACWKSSAYQVDLAVNGREAVEACRHVDYGIVLMDNQMPEMDGRTATREIRKFELAEGKTPVAIIALTADAMQGEREKSLAAGMNDYMSKPFKVVQLSEMLERWSHQARGAAPVLAVAPEPRPESPIDPRVFDDFRSMGMGANDFVVSLIESFLSESTTRLAALDDAASRQDTPALKAASHALKGSSSAVGATGMSALCDQIETLTATAALDGVPALLHRLHVESERVREALRIEQVSSAEPR